MSGAGVSSCANMSGACSVILIKARLVCAGRCCMQQHQRQLQSLPAAGVEMVLRSLWMGYRQAPCTA